MKLYILTLFLIVVRCCSGQHHQHSKSETNQRVLQSPIINGEDATAGDYPWFARGVYSWGSWWGCGGSLVTPEWVLSAAHCEWSTYAYFQIGALCYPYGPSKTNNCNQTIETFPTKQVFHHPFYNSYTLSNDFSLIQLDGQSSITPVSMDQGNVSTSYDGGEKVWAIGFGETESGYASSTLKHVEVSYVATEDCNSYDSYGGSIDDTMMCAADPGEDSCQGDSGGPLYDKLNDTLVGITSWGYGCALPSKPGVYSRIANQWTWIREIICENHSTTNYPDFCEGYSRAPSPSPSTFPSANPSLSDYPSTTPSSSPTYTPCDDDDMEIDVAVFTDSWSYETSWDITNVYTGEELAGVDRYDYSNFKLYEYHICYPTNSCLAFEMRDSFGDGIFLPYGYNFTVDGVVLATSYDDVYGDFDYSEYIKFGDGCVPTLSPTTNPPTISPTFTPCDDEHEKIVKVNVFTDYYSYYSTSWDIKDAETGDFIVGVSLYGYDVRYKLYKHQYCIPSNSCVIFEMRDRYGDGISLPYGYNFTVDDALLATSYDDPYGDFGYSESVRFGDGCSPTPSPTLSSLPTVSSLPSISMAPSFPPPPQNIFVSYWETPSSWTELPSLGLKETMGEPYKTEYIDQINFHSYYGVFAGSGREDDVAACFESRLNFEISGTYTLCLRSDDGSKLYMDGVIIIDLDGLHADDTRCTAIEMTAGSYDIVIEYWERGGYAIMFLLWMTPYSSKIEVIPSSAFVPLEPPEPTMDPTPSDSSEVTPSPDSSGICIENLTFFYKQKHISCHWIGQNDERMERYCEKPLVRYNCPINCNICCADHDAFRFYDWHGNIRNCDWVGSEEEIRKDYCNSYVLKFCPSACGTCWE